MQSQLMEILAVAISGGKGKPRAFEDYLPFKIPDPKSHSWELQQYLGKETARIFFGAIRDGTMPGYVEKEFRRNKVLMEALEGLKIKN